MVRVTLTVPRILRDSADGAPTLELGAERLEAVREEIRRRWPALATHVFTEEGELRPHVLLLHNERLLRELPPDDVALSDGDRLEIVQAVSGG